jgi:hypothetical protein
MLETLHCDNRNCPAYRKPVRWTAVFLSRNRNCKVCGYPMVDGTRSNDDFKNGRKKIGRKPGFRGGSRSGIIREKRSSTKLSRKRIRGKA